MTTGENQGACEIDDEECRSKSKAQTEAPKDDTKVQLKDWDSDEDKEILESIKYAENKIGKKMPTPKVLPKEHPFAPVKYDIEESLSQKDIKATHKEIAKIDEDKGNDAGDCELDDEECKAKSVALVKKPLESEKIQIEEKVRVHDSKLSRSKKDPKITIKLTHDDEKKDDKKDEKKDEKKEEKKDIEKEKKEHEEKIEKLKVHMADPAEVEAIKKSVREQVEQEMKAEFTKKEAEIRKRTEEEVK